MKKWMEQGKQNGTVGGIVFFLIILIILGVTTYPSKARRQRRFGTGVAGGDDIEKSTTLLEKRFSNIEKKLDWLIENKKLEKAKEQKK